MTTLIYLIVTLVTTWVLGLDLTQATILGTISGLIAGIYLVIYRS